ncbi:6007_t:CDS:2, partial [Dentiscutata heterogama]
MKKVLYGFRKFIHLLSALYLFNYLYKLEVLLIVKVSSEVEISHKDGLVLIVAEEYKLPENLQEQLEIAIEEMKKSPKNLQKQLENAIDEVKKSQRILDRQEYFQEYLQKINDFDEKALKIDDLNQMIDLKFEILSNLATLKTGIFLLVEKVKNIDLERICLNEISLTVGEIDKYLPEWINCCTKITNKFEELSYFISKIEDSHFFFTIQEEILSKLADKKTNLNHMSKKIDNLKGFFPSFKNIEKEKKKIQNESYSNFLQIIGLKLVYDLTTELEYATSRLKLLDIQKILEFWKKLSDELRLSEELLKSFEKSELYVKEYYLDYLVDNLTEIGCSINNFCKQIIDGKT